MVLSEADEGGRWRKWMEVGLFLSKWMEGMEEEGGNANEQKVWLGMEGFESAGRWKCRLNNKIAGRKLLVGGWMLKPAL
jgi:hypothetical protein